MVFNIRFYIKQHKTFNQIINQLIMQYGIFKYIKATDNELRLAWSKEFSKF